MNHLWIVKKNVQSSYEQVNQALEGFEPMTFARPVQCSTN